MDAPSMHLFKNNEMLKNVVASNYQSKIPNIYQNIQNIIWWAFGKLIHINKNMDAPNTYFLCECMIIMLTHSIALR